MKALVIFKDGNGHPLSPILKKGFRHCFVCIQTGNYWVEFNVVKSAFRTTVIAGAEYDMENFYRNLGYIVVLTEQRAVPSSLFKLFSGTFMIANCVGMVKRILGIVTFSWTPYSLYKELTND